MLDVSWGLSQEQDWNSHVVLSMVAGSKSKHLQKERQKRGTERTGARRSFVAFYNLAFKIMQHHFCHILFI